MAMARRMVRETEDPCGRATPAACEEEQEGHNARPPNIRSRPRPKGYGMLAGVEEWWGMAPFWVIHAPAGDVGTPHSLGLLLMRPHRLTDGGYSEA